MSPRPPVRILHLGLGAFHRAHQAWYTQRANAAAADDDGWGIAAFTVRRPDAAAALAAQDGRYTLVVRGPEGDAVEVVDSIVDPRAGDDLEAWRAAFAHVPVVTLTVTEVGYALPEDAAREEELALLREEALPASVLGRLLDGLRARRRAGGDAIALVPCDNLDGNGEVLRTRLAVLAEALDPELARWIADRVSFVSTMVDRITPRPDPAEIGAVLDGRADACAVVTEPYTAWVLAGDFPAGRPAWEEAGARVVDDIAPYEQRKLWMLNAGHTLLASLGALRGHRTVAEAVSDPECRRALDLLWDDAGAVLPFSPEELAAERTALLARFGNPRIRHLLDQIAGDGLLKLSLRVAPVIVERARTGLPAGDGQLTAIAAWALAVAAGLAPGPALPSEPVAAARRALELVLPDPSVAPDAAESLSRIAVRLHAREGASLA